MKSRFHAVIALGLLLTLVISPLASLGQNEVGSGGIGGRPAYPRADNDRSKSIFIHTLDPGQTVSDGINVINNAKETKTIDVYATDSVVSSGGAFACAQKVETSKNVGTWIKLSKNRVTLDSAKSEIVPFTITVPPNTDVGEHDGCIVVQEAGAGSQVKQGIGLSFRTAIRVAILVPGQIVKDLAFTGLQVDKQNNKVIISPSIENKGNVSVDANVATDITTLWGNPVSSSGGEFPVLRSQTASWNLKHDSPFWGGWYKTSASATYNSNPDNFIGENGNQSKTIEIDGPMIFVKPQPLALGFEIGSLAVLLYLLFWLWKRQKDNQAVKKLWKDHKVRAGEDIKFYAKHTGTSWRKIARVNKLKKPFSVRPGQTVKLPPKLNKRD